MHKPTATIRRAANIALAIAVCGIALLAPSGASAYSIKKTVAGELVRWWDKPVTLRIGADLERFLEQGEVREAAVMATEAWRGFRGVPGVIIEDGTAPGYTAGRRTNGIYLVSPWPYDAKQLALTISTYTPNGKLIGTDVLVNGEYNWQLLSEDDAEKNGETYDIASVLTHEMGHVLGLDESEDDPGATMWPHLRAGEVHQRTLEHDDEEGIVKLYNAPLPEAAVGCSSASVAGSDIDTSSSTLCVFLALAALTVFRSRRRIRRAA